MKKKMISDVSNAFSTGGGGVSFEHRIQAMFLLLLLTDGFCPEMNEQIKRVCFQAKHLGYDTDDLVVYTHRNQNEGKMLCQIKHSIIVSNNDAFKKVICSAWNDFCKESFDKENDRIAIITSEISKISQKALRFLHSAAIGSIDAMDFLERVEQSRFSNTSTRKTFEIIEECIKEINPEGPSKEELWRFFKVFLLLLSDMDCNESINRALSIATIKNNSSIDPLLEWSKLVDYAGYCNQTASSIDITNIDKKLLDDFQKKRAEISILAPISKMDFFVPVLALIGSWREDNEFDRTAIEKIANMEYSQFEENARRIIACNSEYISLVKGKWEILHQGELLFQCKDVLFDEYLIRLIDVATEVLSQNSKRVISDTRYYIASSSDFDNSNEMREGLAKSLCIIKTMLSTLSRCNQNKIEGAMTLMVRTLLQDADWKRWASLSNCMTYLAELAPEEFISYVEKGVADKPNEILLLFPKKNQDIFGTNYISSVLWALEVLAWYPDYLVKSICALGALEALPYEKTNYVNTPVNSIASILLPWYPQTMADADKKRNALVCLKEERPDVFWRALKKLLPENTTYTMNNPKPQYLPITIPETNEVTIEEARAQFSFCIDLAVETAKDSVEKLSELTIKIEYMDQNILLKYLGYLEDIIASGKSNGIHVLWMKLYGHLVSINIKDTPLLQENSERIQKICEAIEPQDIRIKYQALYLANGKIFSDGEENITWDDMKEKKEKAIREIFDIYGVEEIERFGKAVNNNDDVAYKLGCLLNADEASNILRSCNSQKISKCFTVVCINAFVHRQGVKTLLDTALCEMDEKFIIEIISQIPFSSELQTVIDVLITDEYAYWSKATMPFSYEDSKKREFLLVIDKLIVSRRYISAINLVAHSNFESMLSAEMVYSLLELVGTENSSEEAIIDSYAVSKVVKWLQMQEGLTIEEKSNIDFIFLPILNNNNIKPQALFDRLSCDPNYFCNMMELCYRKKNDNQTKQKLNKAISDRLFSILLRYQIVPGMNAEGNIDEKVFHDWMYRVKVWSKENERYEVTMHTVGSGLSYAKTDKNGLPSQIIIEELNKEDNDELRRGYYLGVMNQRGAHVIDPEGKPELELAKKYKQKAELVEEMGYRRYAEILNSISESYKKESQRSFES